MIPKSFAQPGFFVSFVVSLAFALAASPWLESNPLSGSGPSESTGVNLWVALE